MVLKSKWASTSFSVVTFTDARGLLASALQSRNTDIIGGHSPTFGKQRAGISAENVIGQNKDKSHEYTAHACNGTLYL